MGIFRAIFQQPSSTAEQKLRAEIDDLRRRNSEYFELIERIEKQRDQWKEMFFTQAAQHQTAQEMLQRRLGIVGDQLALLVRRVNVMLKRAGLPTLDSPQSLEALSEDVAAQYGARMGELADQVGEDIQGAAERDRIASGATTK